MRFNLKIRTTKLWYAQGLVVILLFGGCATPVPVTEPSSTSPPPPSSKLPDTATYHTVLPGQTLYAIARQYGRDHREVAQWNNIPPPYELSPGQRIRVDGPDEDSMSDLDDEPGIPVVTPTPPAPTPILNPSIEDSEGNAQATHLVQPGETLYGIATHYGHNFRDVAAWNGIQEPYYLSPGQTLIVAPPSSLPTSPTREPIISEPPQPLAPTQPVVSPRGDENFHIVQSGDSLYAVARRYGLTFNELATWNGLQPPYNLSVGQKLRISPPKEGSLPPTSPGIGGVPTPPSPSRPIGGGDSDYHIVAPGDTLFQIARHYNLNLNDLAKWNNLAPPYSLSVGQKLRITQPSPSTSRTIPGITTPDERYLRPVSTLPSHHIVTKGETLRSLAERYGISVEDLARWNGIGSPYTVYPGLRLKMNP